MKRTFPFIIAFSLLILCSCIPLQKLLQSIDNSNPIDTKLTESLPTNEPLVQSSQSVDEHTLASLPGTVTYEPADLENTYWVTNPNNNAKLYVQVVHSADWDGTPKPGLVLVPGGISTGGNLLPQANILADKGFSVIVFDPDGRGFSQGIEDFGGYIHQDGLAAVISFAQMLSEVESAKIGLVSYSYGVTMTTGVLARYPQLGVKFYIDWEGPIDRYDSTTTQSGECQVSQSKQNWKPCDDEEFWSEREAITFMEQVKIAAYQRVQSEKDHVQPDVTHAVRIVNQAIAAGIEWVRLNDFEINLIYDENNPPQMIPEALEKKRDLQISKYAVELMALFGN